MLDGALGSADVFGVRDGVAVELRQIVPSGLLVRFVDGTRPGRASIVAHSFLWMLTSRGAVEEAMLVGPGVQPLRFRDGRIQPSDTSELANTARTTEPARGLKRTACSRRLLR